MEEDNEFLSLFPHRYDFIWAVHTTPTAKVEWQTETRYPLSDRTIQQGSYLYGVRFGSQTQYFLLDIDTHSPYHPTQDPFAISSIVAALEPLGTTRYVGCTSSYSSGLHLYFPFQQEHNSYQLAIAVATLLENAGFKLHPGHLELFPNPKPYSTEPSLFNAHRLPLQIGSYLVNPDFQAIWSSRDRFVEHWKLAQSRNELDANVLKRILKQLKRPPFKISGKADQFLKDLNAEIEAGWTDYGQTNRLLGRITMRTYIFHHILAGGKPLEGQDLIDEIVAIARSLPGYSEWCRHQHEIEHRAAEWAKCIENSHYYHYGTSVKKSEPSEALPTWNQQQSEAARERIRSAIANLLETETLAIGATARFQQLLKFGIGGGTLYRHRDLWHPNCLTDLPLNPANIKSNCPLDALPLQSNGHCPTSLFPSDGSNAPLSQPSNSLEDSEPAIVGRNPSETDDISQITAAIRETLRCARASYVLQKRASEITLQPQMHDAASHKQIEQMQRFLNSGDPILIREAMTWAKACPNNLDFRQWTASLDRFIEVLREEMLIAISHLSQNNHQFTQSDLSQLNDRELKALLMSFIDTS